MRRPALLLVPLLLLASLLVVPLPTVEAQTETWYARATDSGLMTCADLNADLSQTAGSSATSITLTTSLACWYEPARSVTLSSGDWTATFEFTTSGVGPPETATVRIDITDNAGTVTENIATCTTGNDPSGEFACTASAVAEKTLSDQRIRIAAQEDGASGKTIDVHYDGAAGGSADTRLVHPDESSDPCAAITTSIAGGKANLWFNATADTESNVSADGQTADTPGLNVTNDGTGSCDITLTLLNDEPAGITLKADVDNNPTGAQAVPTSPTTATMCTGVASGGTCSIWLWTDFVDAAEQSTSETLRAESVAAT